MPRSRRRHHSRSASRSRSRSHSHDRDREPKRRKIENCDYNHHKRSVSSEPEAKEHSKIETITNEIENQMEVDIIKEKDSTNLILSEDLVDSSTNTQPEKEDIKNEEGNEVKKEILINSKVEEKEEEENPAKKLDQKEDIIILSSDEESEALDEKNKEDVDDLRDSEGEQKDEVETQKRKKAKKESLKESKAEQRKSGRKKGTPQKIKMEQKKAEKDKDTPKKFKLDQAKEDKEKITSKKMQPTITSLFRNNVNPKKSLEENVTSENSKALEVETPEKNENKSPKKLVVPSPETSSQKLKNCDTMKSDVNQEDYKQISQKDTEIEEVSGNKSRKATQESPQTKSESDGNVSKNKNSDKKEPYESNKEIESSEKVKESTTASNCEEIVEPNDNPKLDNAIPKKPEISDEADESMEVDEPLECSVIEPDEDDLDTPKSVEDLKKNPVTPKRALTPKQIQKKLESEKKKQEKIKEREEREKKKLEEKEEKQKMKEKLKQERDEKKQLEKEQKEKERELKKKEKEDRDEQKRKEKEAEKQKRQQEMDEKNREKNKKVEQVQKAAAVFANFFVAKKVDSNEEGKKKEETSCVFIPFAVKTDMQLAPLIRCDFSGESKETLDYFLINQNGTKLYLNELKEGKSVGRSGKTWPYEDPSDDCLIIDLGETIDERKLEKMKAKFFKFSENQRPPYFGTWRKKSKVIKPRKPIEMDSELLNYEVDSDEEWEDEVDGESITESDKEEKEEESTIENDYEVDNEFFVPHNYLSDDEGVEDEERMNPEALKAQLKIMKNQFEEEHKTKTKKLKPRLIGCIWYDEKVDDAIDKYLQPFSIICQNTITVNKRSETVSKKRKTKGNSLTLNEELIPDFLRLIHGNTNSKKVIIREFLQYLCENNKEPVKKTEIIKQLKHLASWTKCPDGPIQNTLCWYVPEDVLKTYKVDVKLPNSWKYLTDLNA